MRRRHAASLAVALLLTGCGSGGSPAASRSLSASSQPTAATEAPARTGEASVPPTGDGSPPPDGTGRSVDAARSIVLCSSADGSLTLSSRSVEGNVSELVSLPLPIPGWNTTSRDGEDTGPGCDRNQWSGDLKRLVFSGLPEGSTASHVALMDVSTQAITDLTASRQGQGFSAKVLDESYPHFLGTGGNRVNVGNNQVFAMSNGGAEREGLIFDLSQPSKVRHVPVKLQTSIDGDGFYGPVGHSELQVDSGFQPGQGNPRPLANPDGSLIAWGGYVAQPAHAEERVQINCPPLSSSYPLGWVDARHLAVASNAGNGSAALVTLSGQGRVQACTSLLPPTDKIISGQLLSLDGTRLSFSTEGSSGQQVYVVPTSGRLPGEPVPGTADGLPEGTLVWFPIS